MRLWILSATTMAAAAAMGLTLGSYVTSPQRSPLERPATLDAYAQADEAPLSMVDPGPRAVHCTGCGPTLADRQYAAQIAGLDSDGMISGSDDPVVQDYMAQAEAMPTVDYSPPPRIDPPKGQSVRFADSAPVTPPVTPTAPKASAPKPVALVPVAMVPTLEGAGPADAEPSRPIVPTSPQ